MGNGSPLRWWRSPPGRTRHGTLWRRRRRLGAGRRAAAAPLAANDEQEQIARKLARHSGVTVQGPPGTGKSHTIANLVSHLVAHGKRVLVTAHKDQALAVLREKIPAELRDLSLAVLGSSSADLTELQRSVQAITAAADGVDEEREERATAALRNGSTGCGGTWRCCASGSATRWSASRRAWRSAGSGARRRRSPTGSPRTRRCSPASPTR